MHDNRTRFGPRRFGRRIASMLANLDETCCNSVHLLCVHDNGLLAMLCAQPPVLPRIALIAPQRKTNCKP
jgi:hypothetical protein